MYDQHYPNHSYPGSHYPPSAPRYNAGLVGLFGSMIGLTTAILYGGARVVQTIVEGSVWNSAYDCYGGCCGCDSCCHPMHHCYHVKCQPPTYPYYCG